MGGTSIQAVIAPGVFLRCTEPLGGKVAVILSTLWTGWLDVKGITVPPSLLPLAPSPPIIKSKEIRSCEEAVLICWASGNLNPVDSYTVELTQAELPRASGVTE